MDIQELGTRINTGFAGFSTLPKSIFKSGQKPKKSGQNANFGQFYSIKTTQIFLKKWAKTGKWPKILTKAHFSKTKNGQEMDIH